MTAQDRIIELPEPPAASAPKMRVLIADDSPQIRESLGKRERFRYGWPRRNGTDPGTEAVRGGINE